MNAYETIKALCDANGIAITALEKELGFGRGSIGKMKKGSATSAERLQQIADYFGVSLEYLMNGPDTPAQGEPYYLNDDAREFAQFLFENPEYKVLFDASRKVRKEDIQFVKDFLDRVSKA